MFKNLKKYIYFKKKNKKNHWLPSSPAPTNPFPRAEMGSPVEGSAEGYKVMCMCLFWWVMGGSESLLSPFLSFLEELLRNIKIRPFLPHTYTSHRPFDQIVKCLRGNFSAAKLILEFVHPVHLGLGTSTVLAQHC